MGAKSAPIANNAMSAKLVVPVERIELPTFGLQNRCSTAELNRRKIYGIRGPTKSSTDSADRSGGRISDLCAKGQNPGGPGQPIRVQKAAFWAAFLLSSCEVTG